MLVNQSHGHRLPPLTSRLVPWNGVDVRPAWFFFGRPVLLNGATVMAARECLIHVGYVQVTAVGFQGVYEH